MSSYKMVKEGGERTVLSEYIPDKSRYGNSEAYQSEAELEASFIRQLTS